MVISYSKDTLPLFVGGCLIAKHEAKFRYATSNKKVAKVNKKGKITAVGKGKCNVYVYAVSGVSKKIKVTVK